MDRQGDNAPENPHRSQPVATAGVPLEKAKAAMIMMHGRGANADDMLALAREFYYPEFAYLAPNARGNSWYPYSFLAPLSRNEPGLSSALGVIGDLLAQLAAKGFPPEKVMLLGFSQGACLVLEFIARNARRYGGVVGLSGGLIGPEGTPRNTAGSLNGTPVFLGCSNVDIHIPRSRVEETAQVLTAMGADVATRLYAGMGHTVNQDEIRFVQGMMQELLEAN